MKVTINYVAEKAGVSKSTVSRIMNGNYLHNKEDTIKRVLQVVSELDYHPNAIAKSLKSTKTNVVGIVVSNLKNPFWMNVLEGVEDTCRQHGYSLMICNSNEEAGSEKEHIKSFQAKQVDGIIINPTVKNLELYHRLVKDNFPLISINRKLKELNIDTVVMNNIEGTKLAVNHLVKLGKHKIAFFVYPPNDLSPRVERIEGYRQALEENNIPFDPALLQIIPEQPREIKTKLEMLMSGPNRPDAIFSSTSLMTMKILEEMKNLYLDVPEDIAFIGYDETVWSKHLTPALTTVRQPAYEMGAQAADILIDNIHNGSVSPKKIVVLEPELLVRKSCGS